MRSSGSCCPARRRRVPTDTRSAPDYPDPPADPTKQHVLVIAIDGTNMSRVLADDTNENFFELMDTSTNSAPSIVGHTTVSNPSWTAILTGAWDNKTGVINNVYTPQTYDRWPTVFTQLETYDPDIETKAIADWDVIGAIAASGSVGADEVVYISQEPGDTNWSKTDAAVTDETVETLEGPEGTTRTRPRTSSSPISSRSTRTGICTAAIRRSTRKLSSAPTTISVRSWTRWRRGRRKRASPPARARTGPSSSSPTTATSRSRASVTASNHPMRQRHSSSPTVPSSATASSTRTTRSLMSRPRF